MNDGVSNVHEMSVATGIINVLDAKLGQLGSCKLTAVEVAVGELSGIAEDSLRFAVDSLLADKGYADVQLRLRRSPAVFGCAECNWKGQIETFSLHCPQCNAGEMEIINGQDVVLERIEVE